MLDKLIPDIWKVDPDTMRIRIATSCERGEITEGERDLLRAYVLRRENNLYDATVVCRSATQERPPIFAAHRLLVELLLARREMAEAISAAENLHDVAAASGDRALMIEAVMLVAVAHRLAGGTLSPTLDWSIVPKDYFTMVEGVGWWKGENGSVVEIEPPWAGRRPSNDH